MGKTTHWKGKQRIMRARYRGDGKGWNQEENVGFALEKREDRMFRLYTTKELEELYICELVLI